MRSRTAFACLRLLLLGLWTLASCQAPAPATGPAASSTAVRKTATAPAAPRLLPGLPDSLQPRPLSRLEGMPDSMRQAVGRLHAALGPDARTLRVAVLERAWVGYWTLRQKRQLSGPPVLAVADMDLPSTEPRLWVIDLRKERLLHYSHVAHGRGSGGLRARRFSNRIKSACTALGFYRTGGTYHGKHGLSRRLHGLDKGQNHNAIDRYVVLHAADYASGEYLGRHGVLGNSRGCPALPPDRYRAIIKALKPGSCLFIHGQDSAYTSRYVTPAKTYAFWSKSRK